MRILLINPPRVAGFPVVREERFEHKDLGSVYPPQSLLSTAALLEREGYEVKLIDANGFDLKLDDIKQEVRRYKPEVVFIRIGFDTQKEDTKVLKVVKKNCRAKTIARNHIISRTPWLRRKFLLENKSVDIFLNHEPESVILPLLSAIVKEKNLDNVPGISFRNNNRIIDNSPAQLISNLDSLPFPAYHLLPNLDVYYSGTFGPPFVTVLGSRGCPFGCAFCAYGRSLYRTRSPESIAREIEWLSRIYKIHDFCFLDDVVTIDTSRMIAISKAIINKKLNLRWSVGIRAASVNREMLVWMKKAGCDEIAVGIESGSDKILKKINKEESLSDIRKAAGLCHLVGIKFYAMFIIGLPGETKETVRQTIKLAKELKPFYSQFCFATPFPDTKIYRFYKDRKLLLSDNWSKYFPLSEEPVVKTQSLNKQDLIRLRNTAYKETLINFKYLVSQIKPLDWKWNLRGFKELSGRILATLRARPVR